MLDFMTPRETVTITCSGHREHFGKKDPVSLVLPTDWHMPLSPEYFAISVHNQDAAVIVNAGVFVVNFMPAETEISTVSLLERKDADGVEGFYIKNAVAYLSCHVVSHNTFGNFVQIIGKVEAYRELVSGAKRLFHLREGAFTTTRE